MNRLLTLRHTKHILSPLFNGYFANLPKIGVSSFFVNYSPYFNISIGKKRCLYTSSAISQFDKNRSIPTKGSFNKSFLKLPSNREEEIQFLKGFRLANKFDTSSALTELVKSAKIRKHSFSDVFPTELCDMLSEWLSTNGRTSYVVNILKVMRVHGYLNVPLNSQLNRTIGKWIQSDQLNKITHDHYFSFVSSLAYLPSLNLNKKHLTLTASAGKKYIGPETSSYYLVTFMWCWTNMNESLNLKLSQLCPDVFQRWFEVTLPRISQWTEKQCSQCLVALAKEGELPPLEWCKEMAKKLLAFENFDEQACSNLTMSIAKLPDLIPNDSDRKTVLKNLFNDYYGYVQKNRQIVAQGLSNICNALATLHKSDLTDFNIPKKFWNVVLNAKFVDKFNDENVLQMVNSMSYFGVQNVPSPFLEKLFSDFKARQPHTASLILYGIVNKNYGKKIPVPVIKDCFKVWHKGMADLPFEQLTFPRYALNELNSVFKLKPTDIIPDFGPHFWNEIKLRLDQNECKQEKHIFYLIKPHLIFDDVPIDLLNRLLNMTKINDGSALGAANMLWLYGRLSECKIVHLPDDLVRHNFKVWFGGLDSLSEGHLVFGIWCLHCHNISPDTIIPNFWSLYWKKIEKKPFNEQCRTMLRSSVKTFARDIPDDLFKKFMNK